MYFWKVGALAEDLKAKRVSQKEKMRYLLALMIIGTLAILPKPFGEMSDIIVIAGTVVTLVAIVITIGGILLCYDANRQGDDEEFIDRFICISWPIIIRLLIIGIPVMIFIVLFEKAGYIIKDVSVWIIELLFLSGYFLWVHSYILKISGALDIVTPNTME